MAGQGHGDGLIRWLIGGLVAGGIVLGLMVGAYAIGYHRGKSHRGSTAAAAATATTTTETPAGANPVALGRKLFSADACAGCHSLTGTPGAGPTVKGLPGSTVTLANGTTVTADDAYLASSITDPDAQIVKGYQQGVMSGAISSFSLGDKPNDVAALVAFLKTQT